LNSSDSRKNAADCPEDQSHIYSLMVTDKSYTPFTVLKQVFAIAQPL